MIDMIVLILFGAVLAIMFLIFAIYSFGFFVTFSAAPFVRIPKNVLPKIIELLDIKDNSVVYDLGCGDGRVILECYKHNPKARYIGIEKSTMPYFFARIKTRGIDKIKILRGDFFKKDLSQATHLFLYLLPKTMDELLPKLEKELASGTKLVSFNFSFSKKHLEEIIEFLNPKQKRSGLLYLYRF